MVKLLYVTANPKRPAVSKGMKIGEAFLETFIKEQPDTEITHMDLFNLDMPWMDADLISARGKMGGFGVKIDELPKHEKVKVKKMHALADEFISHDYFVFVSPLWNLSSPAVLKNFLDNLFISGKTFNYTATGPKGLLKNKKAIHIQTRGGVYTNTPMEQMESGDRYLKIALRFLGIEVMDSIVAEGLDAFPKMVPDIVAKAKQKAVLAAEEMARSTIQV
ncbi:FMN-dependent NADH-azoreductase [Bacillus sp. T33-2]|uniref:FMN-dependent NADH-azoreductase n=1 Tax=Bacillus sp. T33-2 TaxID=2054168 RepID=UPI000C75EB77|nr:NAD(P)H-dependent oxidoreductase [Bacillus sp. T33-2]PLR94173.1 NAD(P)H dehydrogenase [Bacillus sp. T33-2]